MNKNIRKHERIPGIFLPHYLLLRAMARSGKKPTPKKFEPVKAPGKWPAGLPAQPRADEILCHHPAEPVALPKVPGRVPGDHGLRVFPEIF